MIGDYLSAGYPCLCIQTQEPERVERAIVGKVSGYEIWSWDCLNGIRDTNTWKQLEDVTDPVEMMKNLKGLRDTVIIAHNLHFFFDVPEVKQAIATFVNYWKQQSRCCLVLLSPSVTLPPEIEKVVHVLDMQLPSYEEMIELQQSLIAGVNGAAEEIRVDEACARAAVGLTETEAETVFAKCLSEYGHFDLKEIQNLKAQTIKKSGLMEVWEPENISAVGGLQRLKNWLYKRLKAFLPGGENLPKIRGVLLVGIPGTEKSLMAKVAASIFNRMLIRMDIAALKNSLVGESERRAREATKVVDAIGQSVLWWDEIEKAIGSARSSAQTGDTTGSMFGHFLTWMQESKSEVIIVATANNISQLSAEFIRRFDQVFFVDLPTHEERKEILEIQLKKYGTTFNAPLDIVDRLLGYTGAEIEKVVKESLFDGWDQALRQVVPISKTMKEDIDSLREWARSRALTANTPETPEGPKAKVVSIKQY